MFDGSHWMEEQEVVVRGVDDFVDDGDVGYKVTIASLAGSDAKFVGLKEKLDFTNLDDDQVGMQLLLNSNATTSELGEQTSTRDVCFSILLICVLLILSTLVTLVLLFSLAAT